MNGLVPPTAAELKESLAAHGARPNRGLGQNFLVDPKAMEFAIAAADLGPDDVVLEPGPGTGGLTGLMAGRAGRVVAVEVDRALHEIASERLAGLKNVRLIHSDIMGKGGALSSTVMDILRVELSAVKSARLKVVANLPYCVSTAFIGALLRDGPVPEDMVVTVQREVAERISASPGSRDYGYLSALVQAVAHTKILKRLPPGAFWPQPEIESCILRIRPDADLRERAGNLADLERVVSALFTHRRKQAAKALVLAGLAHTREDAAQSLLAVGVPETVRAEQIPVPQLVQLAKDLGGG